MPGLAPELARVHLRDVRVRQKWRRARLGGGDPTLPHESSFRARPPNRHPYIWCSVGHPMYSGCCRYVPLVVVVMVKTGTRKHRLLYGRVVYRQLVRAVVDIQLGLSSRLPTSVVRDVRAVLASGPEVRCTPHCRSMIAELLVVANGGEIRDRGGWRKRRGLEG